MHQCTALTVGDGRDNKTHDSTNVVGFAFALVFVFLRPRLNSEPEEHLLGLEAPIILIILEASIILTAGVNRS